MSKSLYERVSEFLANEFKEPGHETQVVESDRFDRDDWEYISELVPHLQQNMTKMGYKHDYVHPFYEDMFNLLHQGDPRCRDANDMDPKYKANHTMANEFAKVPEIESLRLSTRNDVYTTAMAMLSLQPAIEEIYERVGEAAKKQQDAEGEYQVAMDGLAAAQESGVGLDEALKAAQAAAHNRVQAQTDLENAANGPSMASAMKKAADEREQENETMRAFGVEDGELQRMPFEERRKLADRLSRNRIAQFAKLIGQFKAVQRAEVRRRVNHAPDEVVGVELGNNLVRMTAGEMLNLSEPALEDDFWRRWADGELVQYRLAGKEKMGKGPIIVVCDESGSMGASYGECTAEAWSKALTLALADQAKRDGRDFHYIGFSSYRQQYQLTFPKGKTTLTDVINFTEHFFGGGTHYETPLAMALKIVQDAAADKKPKPDIVFITDDCYGGMSDEYQRQWTEAREKIGMKVYGVVIGGAGDGEMARLCDNVRSIDQVTANAAAMADVFRTI